MRAVHGIAGPIHMREFARPHGRLAYLTDDQRRALFGDLVGLIRKYQYYSLTISATNLEVQEFFPSRQFRRLFGSTPLAFIWCLVLNHCNAKVHKSHDRLSPMAYVAPVGT